MDAIVLEFISNNWFTITLALMFLKGLASITPGQFDDKIADLFSDVLNFARNGNKPGEPKP